jgi:Zn-dependent peptidase ImmA (M78 family)
MLLDTQKAEAVFRKVKHVREEYRTYTLSPNMNLLSVEDLFSVVSRMYKLQILRYGVPFSAEYTRGMLLRYNNKAIIYVRHQLDDDWKRFTAVKETCHVFLDEQEDWSTDGVKTIADLQSDLTLSANGQVAKKTSQSEALAELAAIELMYPYECRMADLQDGSQSSTKIAIQHGMPQAMVERALMDSYRHVSAFLWARVGQANAAE